MSTLPKNLVTQFVKNTTDNKKTDKKETFLQGYIVKNSKGQYCVKLSNESKDDLYIPVKITTNVNLNQPVTVMIKNHSATVIGNATEIAEETTGNILNNTAASLDITIMPEENIEALWTEYFASR